MTYALYGDNPGTFYEQDLFDKHFKMLAEDTAVCVTKLMGDYNYGEYFIFQPGDLCSVLPNSDGHNVVRVTRYARTLPDMSWWSEYTAALANS